MRPLLTLLVFLALSRPAQAAGDVVKGRTLYNASCMACHGMKGDGKGPAAAALSPRPTDFTAPAFWTGRTDEALKASVRAGKPGTAMMPFSRLSEADLDDISTYLRSLAAAPPPVTPAAP
jgi:high-affinity iron transporter